METIALDTETYRIGPGAVAPKLVCYAVAPSEDKDSLELWATADSGAEENLRELLTPGKYHLVFHNAAFDLAVIAKHYPDLESLIWEKLDRREVSDTMIREMLLNLSTGGAISYRLNPDYTKTKLFYNLGFVVYEYLGVDISETKEDDDSPRLNYDIQDGIPSSQYGADYREYAINDPWYTLRVYNAQESRVQSETGYSSLSTERFHTAASFALFRITEKGIRLDKEAFHELQTYVDQELTEEKLKPLFESGLMEPGIPRLPYKRHLSKATEMVAEWLGVSPDDVDWNQFGWEDGIYDALEDSGLQIKKEGEKAKTKPAKIQQRVLALTIARNSGAPFEDLLKTPLPDLVKFAEENGIHFVKTDKGAVCKDQNVINTLAPHDIPQEGQDISPLECFQQRQELYRLKYTELPRMTWEGEPADRVHFPFNVLVETGRTSCRTSKRYPSGQGQAIDPRARHIFIPRDGYALCACDYSTLELVCVGHMTQQLFGHSEHAEKINAGYDLHAYLGAQLAYNLDDDFRRAAGPDGDGDPAYEYLLSLKDSDTQTYKWWRKLAKPVGLGFASGLGSRTLVGHAKKKPYFIDLQELGRKRLDILEPTWITQYYAKKLYGMEDEFEWNDELIGIAMADKLRGIWFDTYTEMRQYFEWVKEQGDRHTPEIRFSEEEDEGNDTKQGLCYTSPLGMHRAACIYSVVANGYALQTPAAEGFKTALFDLVRACDDPDSDSILNSSAHVVNQIHDEVLVELKDDGLLHERAMEVQKIMEEGMSKVITSVKVTAEPALMRRWRKEAEPVFDSDGRLTIWEPVE